MPVLQHRLLQWVGLSAIVLVLSAHEGLAAVSNLSDSKPRSVSSDWIASASDASVSGENGQYVGQVLVNGSRDTVWAVLTDYNHFDSFLPNVEESHQLQSNGNRVVFEQVNVFRVATLTHRNRVVVTALENYPNQISFSVTDDEVKTLRGTWQIKPMPSNQVLITHQVLIDPGPSIFRGVYLNVYRNQLKNTLTALKQEIERRGK